MSKISLNFVLQNKKISKTLNDMANLQIKSEFIASRGGIFQIMEVFERLGLGKLTDGQPWQEKFELGCLPI